ncbi:type II toxin-antitoxin system Phd/YefM family antitoxin [Geminocystis sp. NIES-3709]|uniref:type II toxin-antitoxin system Phd/YefM family antitoxin n=1 Tax=Geminocystis sp. NIES-3709 TaxID=1617448 RepID=UPI0005FC7E57|nr:type II toxin-antitoxin system Phd/YefM family antitoxin [Geminocystis sp. NIES-3709]BAQ63439.1 YefM protein [Geminocystis sp. NIES-3709]
MQTIHYDHFQENLTVVIDEISEKHQPIRLELSDSVRAIVLSEEDYNSMVETLYLLSNPVNAEKLLQAVNRTPDSATSWQQVKDELIG